MKVILIVLVCLFSCLGCSSDHSTEQTCDEKFKSKVHDQTYSVASIRGNRVYFLHDKEMFLGCCIGCFDTILYPGWTETFPQKAEETP